MDDTTVIWDLGDDEDGNYWHIVVEGHGITREEVDEVLRTPTNPTIESRESGRPITFGHTSLGNYIAVVWEEACDDPRMLYPVTAYHVPPPRERE
jgi:hypothetical protein